MSVIRLQKWESASISTTDSEPNAMYKSDEYTEYILDRQLRLPLPGDEYSPGDQRGRSANTT